MNSSFDTMYAVAVNNLKQCLSVQPYRPDSSEKFIRQMTHDKCVRLLMCNVKAILFIFATNN